MPPRAPPRSRRRSRSSPRSRWATTSACPAAEAGAEVRRLGVARDTLDALLTVLREGVAWADVVVLSGGVSVGAHGHVKAALGTLGDPAPLGGGGRAARAGGRAPCATRHPNAPPPEPDPLAVDGERRDVGLGDPHQPQGIGYGHLSGQRK